MIGNLLNTAMGVIPKQSVEWLQFAGITTDDRGRETASYHDPVTVQASVQPVDSRDYQQFGLDASKRYFTIWASKPMESVTRDGSPDKFEYAGMTLEAVGNDDWLAHNGWRSILCVKI